MPNYSATARCQGLSLHSNHVFTSSFLSNDTKQSPLNYSFSTKCGAHTSTSLLTWSLTILLTAQISISVASLWVCMCVYVSFIMKQRVRENNLFILHLAICIQVRELEENLTRIYVCWAQNLARSWGYRNFPAPYPCWNSWALLLPQDLAVAEGGDATAVPSLGPAWWVHLWENQLLEPWAEREEKSEPQSPRVPGQEEAEIDLTEMERGKETLRHDADSRIGKGRNRKKTH